MSLFGDSLLRKFGAEPPGEWVAAIRALNDYQLRQGMRRMTFSGKPHAPSLPEFVKLCRTVGHLDDVPDQPKVSPFPLLPGGGIDKWDMAGNNRLLAFVLKCGTQRRYFDERQTRILVALKNRWVELIRDSAVNDEVPAEEQQSAWDECMRMAEQEIARELAA